MTAQRWREGQDSYRPKDDERFEPEFHEVVLVPGDNDVAPFVRGHHYSASCPNSGRFRFLLIDRRRPSWGDEAGVVGAAVFGTPSGPQVLKSAFPFLETPDKKAAELQRLVLLDNVRKNGESWFVARCFDHFRRGGELEAIVSFSDPVPRWNESGSLVMPGHVGCVYQALTAWYTGRAKARWTWYVTRTGQQINERDLTKIVAACPCCGSGRSRDGALGAIERLVAWGATRPGTGCLRAWLQATLPTFCVRQKHPGNHRYVWGLNKATRRGLKQLHKGEPDSDLYPKVIDPTERPSWAGRAA